MGSIKNLIREKIIDTISIRAVEKIVRDDKKLEEVRKYSFEVFPDFKDHFSISTENSEVESRIRLLVCKEAAFVKQEIKAVLLGQKKCRYADIGDSDGSVRLLLRKYFSEGEIETLGVNLQPQAVDKMKKRGLNAICADALRLDEKGLRFDVVSLFETLEHLPDPVGFLSRVRKITDSQIVLSIPYIRRSRVSLRYLTHRWPIGKKATVENTHIFELSPGDWEKIFNHTGWEITREEKLMMYPKYSPSRLILEPFWLYMSFDGFWFVSLKKSDRFQGQYSVE